MEFPISECDPSQTTKCVRAQKEWFLNHYCGNLAGHPIMLQLLSLNLLTVILLSLVLLPCFYQADAEEGEARSFIFITEDALTNPDKLLILIHGAGVVRAGQWARRYAYNYTWCRASQWA